MKTKTLKGIVLAFWPFFFLASCSTYYVEKKVAVEQREAKSFLGARIIGVQMRSGDYYRFGGAAPAHMIKDTIVGKAIRPQEYLLSELKSISRDDKGNILRFTDPAGNFEKPVYAVTTKDKLVAYLPGSPVTDVTLPYKEVGMITIQKSNDGGLVGVFVVLVLAAVLVVVIAGTSQPAPPPTPQESCPLVYSYDSKDYVLDAEPYGGAICRGMKRTEWLPLDHLRPVDGRYRLIVANELEEREYTDELKLVVVDHPRGTMVLPDSQGRVHSIQQPAPPIRATDKAGRDITASMCASDGRFWTGHPEAMDPARPETLRDSLTLEFPKPAGAKTVKLIAGAWTTVQGSASAKGILELHGRDLERYLQDIDARGPAFGNLISWYVNEELYLLKVWVKTDTGWQARGLIYGGGPFVAKEKACVLDVHDVPGEVLTVRLDPPLEFWMFDRLSVDYSPDLPLNPVELAADSAVDRNGRDVRAELAANDGVYFQMPNTGDRADLRFKVPPQTTGTERTVLLKASGYYDIRLEAKGEPQRELLDRIDREPGFTLRFTYEWRQKTFGGGIQARRH